jgi:hypothetical protein
MKTLLDYRIEAVDEIELHGLVPHNMRASLEDDRLVVFGCCRDQDGTVVQEKASCKDLNTGAVKIVDMVSRIRHKIEASGPSAVFA